MKCEIEKPWVPETGDFVRLAGYHQKGDFVPAHGGGRLFRVRVTAPSHAGSTGIIESVDGHQAPSKAGGE